MAQLSDAFDATQINPAGPFEVIPAGRYKVQVVASDVRTTKSGSGSYIWIELEIVEGDFQGRHLFDQITLQNPNQQAVDIGQRQLASLCHAVGQLLVSDTEVLHGIPALATVRVRPAKDGFDPSNEIRGYAPVNGGATGPHPVAQPTPPTNSNGAVRPWKVHRPA